MKGSETETFRPVAILETAVYCADLDAARNFYEGVVGLQLFSSEPGRHLFYQVGNSMLLIFVARSTREDTIQIGDQAIPNHGADGESHFAFRVESSQLDAIRANLNHHEVAIESDISWPGGGRSIYCRDPAGNSVEFASATLWPPIASLDGQDAQR